jgi:hypothetical protein
VSTVARLPAHALVERSVVARWMQAWSQLNRKHGLGLVLTILLVSAIELSGIADKLGRPGVGKAAAFDLFASFVLFSVTLLAWSAATFERAATGADRLRAVAAAILVSGLVSAVIIVPVGDVLGIPELWRELMGKAGKPLPPLWLGIIGNTIHLGMFSFAFVLVCEILQRRTAAAAAVLAARHEQATVARSVLESRLSAMQAQVEPQFLFNTLVAVETLYQRDAAAAAENLDRLIQYLRVALPRLREPGSTIAAELDLVRAYLAVVTSLHGGRPALTITVGEDCAGARFYPMLLLPLIQRAVRDEDGGLPDSIRIGVQRVGDEVVIVTRIARPGGCDEDFELARVRERLTGLYGARAALECVELDSGTTQFTLRVSDAR